MLKNVRVLTASALLAAISITIAYFCKMYLTFGMIRITLENLPVFIAGIFFGPLPGLLVAVVSDLISCLLAPNAVNPVITLGAASIGLLGGLFPRIFSKVNESIKIILTVFLSHAVGSMLIKSLGMRLYFGIDIKVLLYRIPLYIGISAAEAAILIFISKNKTLCGQLRRLSK